VPPTVMTSHCIECGSPGAAIWTYKPDPWWYRALIRLTRYRVRARLRNERGPICQVCAGWVDPASSPYLGVKFEGWKPAR
jgi:hypothetical protein